MTIVVEKVKVQVRKFRYLKERLSEAWNRKENFKQESSLLKVISSMNLQVPKHLSSTKCVLSYE